MTNFGLVDSSGITINYSKDLRKIPIYDVAMFIWVITYPQPG
jgi:hypothetical protein